MRVDNPKRDEGSVGCPDEDAVLRYLSGDVRGRSDAIEAHVDRCGACRALLTHLARTSLMAGTPPPLEDEPPPLGEFLPTGTAVGPYRVRRVLGTGGMGVVYEAHDPRLDRVVAVKVLRSALAHVPGHRLVAEARAMARASHPNVCAVFDVGMVGARPYLAMERIEGGTLADWLTAQPRGRTAIVDAFAAAGRGLAAAHAIGVVHRDFKPSNVLVDETGRVVVCDFGLAASNLETSTPSGGTPRYMAPEQRDGRGDARVDQFAFAVALREALRQFRLPRRLRQAIDRASADDPAERFEDMHAFLAALRPPRRRRITRAWRVGASALALVGATLMVVQAPAAPRPEPAETTPSEPPQVAPSVQALLDESIVLGRAADPTGTLEKLDDAVDEARRLEDAAGLSLALAARGSQLGKLGKPVDAIADLEESFHRATQIHRDDIAADAAIIIVGLLAGTAGGHEEALAWARHAEGSLLRVEDLEPRAQADFHAVVGSAHAAAGERDAARQRYEKAIAIVRADSPRLDRHLVVKLADLSTLELDAGNKKRARSLVEESLAVAKRVHGPRHPETGAVRANLARIQAADDDVEGALTSLRASREILVEAYGEGHPNVIAVDSSRAALLKKAGRLDETLELLEAALGRADGRGPNTCELERRVAATLALLHRCTEARPRYRAAIDCFEAALGPQTPAADPARRGLAECNEPPVSPRR